MEYLKQEERTMSPIDCERVSIYKQVARTTVKQLLDYCISAFDESITGQCFTAERIS